jgi:hypothetical protein
MENMPMRATLALLPLTLLAAPAIAAPQQPQVPRQLNDPATIDRLTSAVQALSRAMMDMPVGQIQAAVEGRPVTPADRNRKLRDIEPGLDREVAAQMAQAKPRIQASMKALSDAMPAMMQSLYEAKKALERAEANMPDPNYPKR